MRPLHVRLKGITRYTAPLDLDLRDVPPGLVAIVGPNGAGKSTLMECMAPLPLYLELPSYPGKLADNFQPDVRDGVVDVEIEWAGHVYRHVIQVDPSWSRGRGKAEAFLYRDGQPDPARPTPGRLSDYRLATAGLYPPRNVFLAAAFSVQSGAGNWFDLDRVQRRDLFAKLLGLEHWQTMAERAREHRKACDAAAADLAKREGPLLDQRATRDQLVNTRVGHAADANAHAKIVAGLETAQLAVIEARAAAAAAFAQARDLIDKNADARQKLAGRRDAAEGRRATAWHRLDGLLARLEGRERVEADAGALKALRTDRGLRAGAHHRSDIESTKAEDTRRNHYARLAQLEVDREQLERRLASRDERELQREELKPLALVLAGLKDKIEAAGELSAQEEAKAADAAGLKVDGLERDYDQLKASIAAAETTAALIGRVPCGGGVVFQDGRRSGEHVERVSIDCADCELLTGAQAAAAGLAGDRTRLIELEQKLAAAEQAKKTADKILETARAAVDQRMADRSSLRELAYVPGRIEELDRDLAAAGTVSADLDAKRAGILAAKFETEMIDSAAAAAMVVAEEARHKLAVIDNQIAGLDGADDRATELAAAVAQEPGLRQQLADAEKAKAEAAADLDAMPAADTTEADRLGVTLDEAEAEMGGGQLELQDARRNSNSAQASLARLDGRLDEIGDVDARLVELAGRRAKVDSLRSGWVLLERGFGRDGIQALEIDAAGPEVSELVNELLAACFGPRFTCSLRTVQTAAGARKQKEVFDLDILDGERGGAARPAERFSTGERTLISEALKLALAIFNARRQTIPILTLWRDECDGSLEPALAVRYPGMLRRARDLGGYQWVYLISHNRDVWSQADTLIRVADGGAVVEAQL